MYQTSCVLTDLVAIKHHINSIVKTLLVVPLAQDHAQLSITSNSSTSLVSWAESSQICVW